MTNKTLTENEWTLWVYQPIKSYPCKWYFWLDGDSIMRFARSIEPLGFIPVQIDKSWLDKKVNLKEFGCSKVKTKMTQEQLIQGWFLV